MKNKSLVIAKYTAKENLSNKIAIGFLVFSIILLFGFSILKELTIDNNLEMVKDIGLFFIESFLLLITVFLSSSIIIKAHKDKSIYLILTKPVNRSEYVFGIFLGILSIIFCYEFFLGGILTLVLKFQGYMFNKIYFLSYLYILYKFIILISIGILFSLISDSYITGNIFTFLIYFIAHASYDIKNIMEKTGDILIKTIMKILYFIMPKFHYLNLRDNLDYNYIFDYMDFLYVIFYTILVLIISVIIFNKRKL
ncbi:hypothetical protein EV215_1338 [Hypnocyclicus thermotrophus]|uniref:ABC-2 family transporter n=1 Tax=Hypnocyclicus thermotrophus TaxID=1627895 RepID=A0AA46DY89_9FUSO|nr:ABC transporter permease subunit [Hypnocyclicus thermotrophus]TDT69798.1 hypothetical protein EV215_1338 [Hypnocyclicus thermotrophus]